MHTGRILRIAKDLVDDSKELKILDFLQEAVSLAQESHGVPDHVYRQKAAAISKRAADITKGTRFRRYPQALLDILQGTEFVNALPGNIASKIRVGFPEDRSLAISSGEMRFILQNAQESIGQLRTFLTTAKRLQIDEIKIPDQLVSLDIEAPAEAPKVSIDDYLGFISACAVSINYFGELATGTRETPVLVYTSTSFPVVGLGMIPAAAYGMLKLYEKALDVGVKHVALLQAWKTFRDANLTSIGFGQEQLRELVASETTKAVREVVRSIPTNLTEGRVNEIVTALNREAPTIFKMVIKGARIGITIESLSDNRLEAMAAVAGESVDRLTAEIENRRVVENKLKADLVYLESDPALLLSSQGTDDVQG